MRRTTTLFIALLTVLGLIAAGCGSDDDGEGAGASATADEGSGAPEPNPDLEASEIGVSGSEIRIVVIADVENPAAPGLFRGSKDGVEAFAAHVNRNGGVAGRKLVVDFIDSKLSADAAQNGVFDACENAFALVGTSALFMNNVAPIAECKDKAGAPAGLPDFAVVTTSFAHQCSPTTYTASGTPLDCSTKDEHPQAYRVPVGVPKYFMKEMGVKRGAWIAGNDIKGTLDATRPLIAGEQSMGIEGAPFLISGRAPQSDYTPFVQKLKADKVEYLQNFGSGHHLAQALKEMTIQGSRPKAIVCTTACYSKGFLTEAGNTAEGVYVTPAQVPIEEADEVPAVRAMVDALGEKIDGFATLAWVSGLLFVAAVEKAVEEHGENGVTRANVLDALETMKDFDADGMLGAPSDIGAKTAAPCFAVLQVKGGEFTRIYPKKAGTLDCTPANRIDIDFNNE